MFENELSKLFNEIANEVNQIIPVLWEDFYLYAELNNGDGEVLFYFNTPQNPEKFIYSHDIPELYDVTFSEYMDTFNRLMNHARAILTLFEENDQPKWYEMTLSVKTRKTLNVDFDYTDWSMSPFTANQRLSYFRYRFLGEKAENEDMVQLFKAMEAFQAEHNSK